MSDTRGEFEAWMANNYQSPISELMFRLWHDNRELRDLVSVLKEELNLTGTEILNCYMEQGK